MTLELTLLIQAALAVMGGTATVAGMVLHKKTAKGFALVPLWMFYTFYNFWGMAAVRSLLLYDEIPAYGENMYLLFLDLAASVGITVFLLVTNEQQRKAGICVKTAACAVLVVMNGFQFVVLVRQYTNVNTVLYEALRPDRIVIQGLIVMVGYLILGRIFGSDRCKKWVMPVAVSMLYVITLYLAPVFETLIANQNEFMFAIKDVWYLFLAFGVAVSAAIIAILLLVSEKRCRILCAVLWAYCISAYLQGMLLNGSLFLMDGKKPDWSNGLKTMNLLLWCACLAGLAALCHFAGRAAQKMIVYSSLVLCIMQVVGVISLIPACQKDKVQKEDVLYENYLSMEGIGEVASEENVIVFVLDTYDVDFLEQVLEIQPDFLDPLKGFIFYPDNVSQFSRTLPSIPYMLTEQTYFYEESITDYVDRAFSECIFWEGLRKEGYQYYLFEVDENYIGDRVLEEAANFVTKGTVFAEEYSFWGCVEAAVRIGSYRLMPYFVKDCFSYTSGDIDHMVISRRVLDRPMYSEEDAYLWEQLRESGLVVGDDKKAFRFIHTKGAHAPYTMNERGEWVGEEEIVPEQMYEGSMRFVYDYLEQMQRLGVYEQSMIIITADHGENFVTEELTQETNPILFIKPRGVSADVPLQTSDIMASQNDLLPTISAAIGIEYVDSWGLDLLNPNGKERTRTRCHYYAVVENSIQTKTRKYNIDGNSRDFANWTATDEYHEFGEFY